MGCKICQIEPDSPWQNSAEGAIHEVKHEARRKQAKKRSPLKLSDHCLQLEACIRSNVALNSYELQGQVPESNINTPEYELYADNDQGAGIHTPEIDNVTPQDFEPQLMMQVGPPKDDICVCSGTRAAYYWKDFLT